MFINIILSTDFLIFENCKIRNKTNWNGFFVNSHFQKAKNIQHISYCEERNLM